MIRMNKPIKVREGCLLRISDWTLRKGGAVFAREGSDDGGRRSSCGFIFGFQVFDVAADFSLLPLRAAAATFAASGARASRAERRSRGRPPNNCVLPRAGEAATAGRGSQRRRVARSGRSENIEYDG